MKALPGFSELLLSGLRENVPEAQIYLFDTLQLSRVPISDYLNVDLSDFTLELDVILNSEEIFQLCFEYYEELNGKLYRFKRIVSIIFV